MSIWQLKSDSIMWQTPGSYKTRNRTEWNGTESNWCTIVHHGTESLSCVLYQPRRRDKHPADSIDSHQAYLAAYLVSSSVVANPSLTSEGLAMSLPSLAPAVGSRFTCGSPWNRKGMVSFSVLSTNTKQASPQSVRLHVYIRQARTAVDSAMRLSITYSSVY